METDETKRNGRRERLLREFYRNALAIAMIKQCLVSHPSFDKAPEEADAQNRVPPHLQG